MTSKEKLPIPVERGHTSLYRPSQSDLGFYIPKRYILTVLGFLGICSMYILRYNLSVALVAMVNTTESADGTHHTIECEELIHYANMSRAAKTYKGEQYNWDSKTQGYIMSSFFYCYFVTVFTGGYFVDKFGAKLMFGGGIFVTGLLTLLTPVVVRWGLIPFIVLRALEGIGEGLTYPAINALIGRWSPKYERSRISSAIFTGSAVGSFFSLTVSGWLSSSGFLGGWPSVFYVSGIIACVWYIFWALFIYENPDDHPRISKEELSLFFEADGSPICEKVYSVPWLKIVTSIPMWAVLIAQIGSYFGLVLLLTETPTFLNRVMHFSITTSGVVAGIPYLCEWFGAWVSSFIADKLISSRTLSITLVRKLFNSIAFFGSGLCLIGITLSGCERIQVIILFSLSLWLYGFKYSGFNVIHVDMCPPLAGTLYGVANGVACLTGIAGPIMTGTFTASGDTIENWNNVFYVTAAVYFVTGIFFDIFASAEPQTWLKKTQTSKPTTPKKEKPQRSFPKRYIVAILGFFGLACMYAMQFNLSMTVLAMRNNSQNPSTVECPLLVEKKTKSDSFQFIGPRYDWVTRDQGLILGSFYYGYFLTQLPGGYLSLFVSPKWIFGIGIFLSGLLCIAIPVAANLGTGALVAVRVLQGLSQGVTKPALSAIVSRWAPRYERSQMSTFMTTGGLAGTVLSLTLSGLISSSKALGGWPTVFFLFGMITCVWFVFWVLLIHDGPEMHPHISPSELFYFCETIEEIPKKIPSVPWKSIFSSTPMWAVIVAHFGYSFGNLTLFTELPNYMENVLHFNIRENGVLSALPSVVQTLTAWISSYTADKLRATRKLHVTAIRKVFNSVGLYGPAVFLLMVTLFECNAQGIIILISMAQACNGFAYSGFNITHVDMSPVFAGTLYGISHSFSTLSGIIAPVFVGYLTSNNGEIILGWNRVFYVIVIVYAFCGTFYNMFASAELQPWGIADETNPDKTFSNKP